VLSASTVRIFRTKRTARTATKVSLRRHFLALTNESRARANMSVVEKLKEAKDKLKAAAHEQKGKLEEKARHAKEAMRERSEEKKSAAEDKASELKGKVESKADEAKDQMHKT
jgi:hypothetical protein